MKKIYNSPIIRIAELDNQAIIATSPSIEGGPSVASNKEITDDNIDDFEADSRTSLWDQEW